MEWFRLTPQRQRDLLMAYTATFDPVAVVRRHAVPGLAPQPGRLTNFLGTSVDPEYFGAVLHGTNGTVEAMPIPGNWHACVAEWAACLRALELAGRPFTMVELGCGWGCWLNNMAVAARRAGVESVLIGVEGDADHRAFARQTLAENGVPAGAITLHAGIAAAGTGHALFPRQRIRGRSWGLRPVFNATDAQRARARASGAYDELPLVPVHTLVSGHDRVDLMHVDIQGGEADLVEGSLPVLAEKVACLVIGTHGRGLERRLRTALGGAGWVLEIERPAIFKMHITGPRLKIDGLQGWRNPRLLPTVA